MVDVADELDELQALRDALVDVVERADAVARYTEVDGVKDISLVLRGMVQGQLQVVELMNRLVVRAE